MKDEQRQRLGTDAEKQQIGSDAEEQPAVALDEDLALDTEQSDRVKGGNDGDLAASAGDGGLGGDGW